TGPDALRAPAGPRGRRPPVGRGALDHRPVPVHPARPPGLRRVRAVPAGAGRPVLPVRVARLRVLHLRGAAELSRPGRGRRLPGGDRQRPGADHLLRGDPAGGRAGAGRDPAARAGAGNGLLPHRDLPAPGRGAGGGRRGVATDLLPERDAERRAARPGPGGPDPRLAALGLIGTWWQLGLVVLVLLSGMIRIPAELFEAARLDGAGPVREFFAITLPSVRGEITVALVLTIIAALKTFDLVYMTTSGG